VWNSERVRMEADRKCLLELDSIPVSEVLGSCGVRVMSRNN
jgi:hypothetical protein